MTFVNHNLAFVKPNNSFKMFSRKPLIVNNIPLNGLDIGIPLNIIDNVFTNLHYGYDITTVKMIVLQFLIGYYTYGKDRYKDSIEYFEDSSYMIKDKKLELYQAIYKYKEFYQASYCIVFVIISSLIYDQDNTFFNIPVIMALYSTEYYKQLKTKWVGIKPLFVSGMWTFATVLLPCILHDHDYSIIKDVHDYLPCFFSLFACTNLADMKDIEEDTINNIKTLPVVIGKQNTQYIILISLFLSSYMFGMNPHYQDRPIVNSAFELQNMVLSGITYFI